MCEIKKSVDVWSLVLWLSGSSYALSTSLHSPLHYITPLLDCGYPNMRGLFLSKATKVLLYPSDLSRAACHSLLKISVVWMCFMWNQLLDVTRFSHFLLVSYSKHHKILSYHIYLVKTDFTCAVILGTTLSIELKRTDYIESILASTANKVGSMYRARILFTSDSICHIYKYTISSVYRIILPYIVWCTWCTFWVS